MPALLAEPGEDVVDVPDQLDLGDEVRVRLGRDRVDADDRLVAVRVPVLGRVLDEVVADREHHVGLAEAGHLVVARLEADRAERLVVVGREEALAHERLRHRDAGGADELAQRRAPPWRGSRRCPASATGRTAPRMMSAARSSSRAGGSGSTARLRGSGAPSISVAMTSSGSSMWVAPGFSLSATLNALRTTSGMISGSCDARVPLRDRAHHPRQVDVLVRLLVHPLEVALAGERHERSAVEVGVRHGGDEVERARARACRGRPRRGRSGAPTRRPCRRRPARAGPG